MYFVSYARPLDDNLLLYFRLALRLPNVCIDLYNLRQTDVLDLSLR